MRTQTVRRRETRFDAAGFAGSKANAMNPEIARNQDYNHNDTDNSKDIHDTIFLQYNTMKW